MVKRLFEIIIAKKGLLLLSMLLGVNLAFYFSAYLENSPIFIPLGSTRMWAYTLVVSASATLLYFIALIWASKNLTGFENPSGLAFVSFILGTILFFTNTSQWLEPEFYVRATLPISYELHVPWYASVAMAYGTGIVFYATLVYFLFALLAPKKDEILATLAEKLSASAVQDDKVNERLLVALFVIGAFVLRVINLNILPPHIEEYQHLIAAKELLTGTPASDLYQRGLYLVTLPVMLMFSLFGTEVWAARLPGLIVNSLAVIPLYWLVRRYHRTIAMLSAALYITSPWVISLSRPVREYAYQPLMYYLVLASVLYLLSNIRQGFLLLEWRKLFVKKNLWAWAILVFFVVFVLVIDPYSSFKVVALLYLVFGFFFLSRLDWQSSTNRWIVGIVGGMGVLAAGVLSVLILTDPAISAKLGNPFKALQVNDLLINFRNGNAKVLFGQFFFQPATQWYYERILFFPLLSFFFVFWWSWRTRKSNPFLWFLVLLYSVSFLAFAFLYQFIYAPRFFLHLQLWFIPLMAFGVYGWYVISTVLLRDVRWRVVLWALVALATVNFQQLLIHTTTAKPVSYAIHMDFAEVENYMTAHARSEDILLSKFYGRYVRFTGQPEFATIYETSYDESLILDNVSGWIVIDSSRYWAYRKILKRQDFTLGDVQVEFVGEFPDPASGLSNYLWHWDTMP